MAQPVITFLAVACLLLAPAASSEIGVNFELNEQRTRLDTDVAAQRLADLSVTKAKTFSSPATTLGAQQVDALLANGVTDLIVGAPGMLSSSEADQIAAVLSSKLVACGRCSFTVAVANEPTRPATYVNLDDVSESLRVMTAALQAAGIADSVAVTVPFSGSVTNGAFPPESCMFKQQYKAHMVRIVEQIQAAGGTFAVNLYPFFAMPNAHISLDYALGNSAGRIDGVADSLLDAQFICTVASLREAGIADTTVMVTETGWPTSGDAHDLANAVNAATYNTNTANWARARSYEVYLFEMFDELLKGGGGGVEPHWGLMDESGTAKYALDQIFDGIIIDPPPLPPPPPATSCTSANNDPWATGQEVKCCAGTEKELRDWNGDGNWSFRCTPPSLLSPCTPADSDPWASGQEVPCCAGTEKELRNWNGDGNWSYRCSLPRLLSEAVRVNLRGAGGGE